MKEKVHIAPCGMNCVLCYAYQRTGKQCPGCLGGPGNKPHHCSACAIAHCEHLAGESLRLCVFCSKRFPCQRMKRLDKRYTVKYGTGLVANQQYIRSEGLEAFILSEEQKWTCPGCGNFFCIHHAECLHCGSVNPHFITNRKPDQDERE